jgi:hypothetical protein
MAAIDDFERMCEPISVEDLNRLARRAATHVDLIAEAALEASELPVVLAERLAEGLEALARSAGQVTPDQRALIRGALEYFLLTGDANDDLSGSHGLDDDRDVFNEVCDRLGRPQLKIPS